MPCICCGPEAPLLLRRRLHAKTAAINEAWRSPEDCEEGFFPRLVEILDAGIGEIVAAGLEEAGGEDAAVVKTCNFVTGGSSSSTSRVSRSRPRAMHTCREEPKAVAKIALGTRVQGTIAQASSVGWTEEYHKESLAQWRSQSSSSRGELLVSADGIAASKPPKTSASVSDPEAAGSSQEISGGSEETNADRDLDKANPRLAKMQRMKSIADTWVSLRTSLNRVGGWLSYFRMPLERISESTMMQLEQGGGGVIELGDDSSLQVFSDRINACNKLIRRVHCKYICMELKHGIQSLQIQWTKAIEHQLDMLDMQLSIDSNIEDKDIESAKSHLVDFESRSNICADSLRDRLKLAISECVEQHRLAKQHREELKRQNEKRTRFNRSLSGASLRSTSSKTSQSSRHCIRRKASRSNFQKMKSQMNLEQALHEADLGELHTEDFQSTQMGNEASLDDIHEEAYEEVDAAQVMDEFRKSKAVFEDWFAHPLYLVSKLDSQREDLLQSQRKVLHDIEDLKTDLTEQVSDVTRQMRAQVEALEYQAEALKAGKVELQRDIAIQKIRIAWERYGAWREVWRADLLWYKRLKLQQHHEYIDAWDIFQNSPRIGLFPEGRESLQLMEKMNMMAKDKIHFRHPIQVRWHALQSEQLKYWDTVRKRCPTHQTVIADRCSALADSDPSHFGLDSFISDYSEGLEQVMPKTDEIYGLVQVDLVRFEQLSNSEALKSSASSKSCKKLHKELTGLDDTLGKERKAVQALQRDDGFPSRFRSLSEQIKRLAERAMLFASVDAPHRFASLAEYDKQVQQFSIELKRVLYSPSHDDDSGSSNFSLINLLRKLIDDLRVWMSLQDQRIKFESAASKLRQIVVGAKKKYELKQRAKNVEYFGTSEEWQAKKQKKKDKMSKATADFKETVLRPIEAKMQESEAVIKQLREEFPSEEHQALLLQKKLHEISFEYADMKKKIQALRDERGGLSKALDEAMLERSALERELRTGHVNNIADLATLKAIVAMQACFRGKMVRESLRVLRLVSTNPEELVDYDMSPAVAKAYDHFIAESDAAATKIILHERESMKLKRESMKKSGSLRRQSTIAKLRRSSTIKSAFVDPSTHDESSSDEEDDDDEDDSEFLLKFEGDLRSMERKGGMKRATKSNAASPKRRKSEKKPEKRFTSHTAKKRQSTRKKSVKKTDRRSSSRTDQTAGQDVTVEEAQMSEASESDSSDDSDDAFVAFKKERTLGTMSLWQAEAVARKALRKKEHELKICQEFEKQFVLFYTCMKQLMPKRKLEKVWLNNIGMKYEEARKSLAMVDQVSSQGARALFAVERKQLAHTSAVLQTSTDHIVDQLQKMHALCKNEDQQEQLTRKVLDDEADTHTAVRRLSWQVTRKWVEEDILEDQSEADAENQVTGETDKQVIGLVEEAGRDGDIEVVHPAANKDHVHFAAHGDQKFVPDVEKAAQADLVFLQEVQKAVQEDLTSSESSECSSESDSESVVDFQAFKSASSWKSASSLVRAVSSLVPRKSMSLREPRELMKGKASDKLLHMDKIRSSPTPGSSRGEWMRESRSTMKGIEGRDPSKLTMKVLEARRARANAALGRGPDDPRMSSLGRDSTAGSSRPSTAGSSTRSHRKTGRRTTGGTGYLLANRRKTRHSIHGGFSDSESEDSQSSFSSSDSKEEQEDEMSRSAQLGFSRVATEETNEDRLKRLRMERDQFYKNLKKKAQVEREEKKLKRMRLEAALAEAMKQGDFADQTALERYRELERLLVQVPKWDEAPDIPTKSKPPLDWVRDGVMELFHDRGLHHVFSAGAARKGIPDIKKKPGAQTPRASSCKALLSVLEDVCVTTDRKLISENLDAESQEPPQQMIRENTQRTGQSGEEKPEQEGSSGCDQHPAVASGLKSALKGRTIRRLAMDASAASEFRPRVCVTIESSPSKSSPSNTPKPTCSTPEEEDFKEDVNPLASIMSISKLQPTSIQIEPSKVFKKRKALVTWASEISDSSNLAVEAVESRTAKHTPLRIVSALDGLFCLLKRFLSGKGDAPLQLGRSKFALPPHAFTHMRSVTVRKRLQRLRKMYTKADDIDESSIAQAADLQGHGTSVHESLIQAERVRETYELLLAARRELQKPPHEPESNTCNIPPVQQKRHGALQKLRALVEVRSGNCRPMGASGLKRWLTDPPDNHPPEAEIQAFAKNVPWRGLTMLYNSIQHLANTTDQDQSTQNCVTISSTQGFTNRPALGKEGTSDGLAKFRKTMLRNVLRQGERRGSQSSGKGAIRHGSTIPLSQKLAAIEAALSRAGPTTALQTRCLSESSEDELSDTILADPAHSISLEPSCSLEQSDSLNPSVSLEPKGEASGEASGITAFVSQSLSDIPLSVPLSRVGSDANSQIHFSSQLDASSESHMSCTNVPRVLAALDALGTPSIPVSAKRVSKGAIASNSRQGATSPSSSGAGTYPSNRERAVLTPLASIRGMSPFAEQSEISADDFQSGHRITPFAEHSYVNVPPETGRSSSEALRSTSAEPSGELWPLLQRWSVSSETSRALTAEGVGLATHVGLQAGVNQDARWDQVHRSGARSVPPSRKVGATSTPHLPTLQHHFRSEDSPLDATALSVKPSVMHGSIASSSTPIPSSATDDKAKGQCLHGSPMQDLPVTWGDRHHLLAAEIDRPHTVAHMASRRQRLVPSLPPTGTVEHARPHSVAHGISSTPRRRLISPSLQDANSVRPLESHSHDNPRQLSSTPIEVDIMQATMLLKYKCSEAVKSPHVGSRTHTALDFIKDPRAMQRLDSTPNALQSVASPSSVSEEPKLADQPTVNPCIHLAPAMQHTVTVDAVQEDGATSPHERISSPARLRQLLCEPDDLPDVEVNRIMHSYEKDYDWSSLSTLLDTLGVEEVELRRSASPRKLVVVTPPCTEAVLQRTVVDKQIPMEFEVCGSGWGAGEVSGAESPAVSARRNSMLQQSRYASKSPGHQRAYSSQQAVRIHSNEGVTFLETASEVDRIEDFTLRPRALQTPTLQNRAAGSVVVTTPEPNIEDMIGSRTSSPDEEVQGVSNYISLATTARSGLAPGSKAGSTVRTAAMPSLTAKKQTLAATLPADIVGTVLGEEVAAAIPAPVTQSSLSGIVAGSHPTELSPPSARSLPNVANAQSKQSTLLSRNAWTSSYLPSKAHQTARLGHPRKTPKLGSLVQGIEKRNGS